MALLQSTSQSTKPAQLRPSAARVSFTSPVYDLGVTSEAPLRTPGGLTC